MSSEAGSRLCPDCRSDSIPRKSCTNCAQARRINELEQTVEELCEHVEALVADERDNAEKTTQIPTAGRESP